MSTAEGSAQAPAYPSLCKSGCGFFSSVDGKGFCSICYKEFLKKEPNTEATTTAEVSEATVSLANLNVSVEEANDLLEETATVAEIVADEAVAKAATVAEETLEPVEVKKVKKNRCLSCKKKLGLTGFECRCGGQYCGIHRYSDKHACSFDYNAMGKAQIAAANPLVVAEKVKKF